MASRARSVVEAVAGLSDGELTNLGLTPEQRAAARRALDRGDNPPEIRRSAPRLTAADKVVWRDIADVKKDIGLDALPAHITPFAEFMGFMAQKAATGSMSPRDLLKAYTITRSSVNRAAVATGGKLGKVKSFEQDSEVSRAQCQLVASYRLPAWLPRKHEVRDDTA